MPQATSGNAEPLEAMAACNQRLLLHCADLRRLGLAARGSGSDGDAAAATAQLLDFFDHELPLHHADQETDLFPALIESMAGSDAVCLRDINEGLSQQHREVHRHWLRLRPALLALATDGGHALPTQDIDSFLAQCEACVAREDGELLPMAARLLSDGELQRLAAAMRQRRSGPT